MTETRSETFDLIGIGFGPSNLALAIALHERGQRLRTRFLEARLQFAWHPDMMIPGSDMQVSFMKDLVSLRNPQSAFSFVSYLHAKGRLSRFINRKTFFPSREEFNDYLGWAAAQLPVCSYDSRVTDVQPVERGGRVTELAVTSESADGTRSTRHARSLVLAPGGTPYWPETLRGLRRSERALHSQHYLSTVARRLKPGMRVAVIGGGQSAAEIFADLTARPEAPEVDLILRGRALMPSDDTPFVNEIFDPEQTDNFHARSEEDRLRMLTGLAATNYSVVDGDLIEQIYNIFYEQEISGGARFGLCAETRITAAEDTGDHIALSLSGPGKTGRQQYDLVILATGYRREIADTVLSGLAPWQQGAPDRRYRLPMASSFEPAIFVQGFSEPTHGISDTLLSILALKSEEIAQELEAHHEVGEAAVAAE